MDDFIGLLDHRQLVVTNGHHFGLERADICRLADGIHQKTDRQRAGETFLRDLVFHRRVTLHAGDGDNVHVQRGQLGERGQGGLQANRGERRVDARRQIISQHFGNVIADFLRIAAVIGQALQVGDQNILLIFMLQGHALAQRTDIMAEMQRAGRTIAGENGDFAVHKRLLTF